MIRSLGVGILILRLRKVQAYLGKLNHLQRADCETLPPPVYTGVQGAPLISAHTWTRTLSRASSLPRDSVGWAMNIIMKTGGHHRQRGCARHKDGCEARSTTSIVLLRSSRFSSTCYCTASLMIAAEMTPAFALDASAPPNSHACFFAGVDRCEEPVFSFNGKERGNLAGRRKTCVRIAAPRHKANNGHRHVNRTVSELDAKVPSHLQEILYFFWSLPRTKNVRQLHIHGRDITRIDETLLCAWVAL